MRDLVVIGGGVGGLVTASVAGQLGLDVVLVERSARLGGDCLHHGCVPSKTLLRSAQVAHLMRRAPDFGLPATARPAVFADVRRRVHEVIDTIQAHDDPERFRGYGVDVLFGEARFTAPDEVSVKGERIRARRFVIATGSRPAVPAVPGLAEAGYLTNEDVFDLDGLPERLAVVGAGPVGVELAQAFARLGSAVTVIEAAGEILPREEPAVAGELREALEAEGVRFRLGARLERVEREPGGLTLQVHQGTEHLPVVADRILVAVGREANAGGLGLEAAGVEHGPAGIRVDARMRTSRRHIFACGDVTGLYPFTHMAEYQAGIVIANAVFRWPKRADYRVVPRVTYTDPELAAVGLSETEAHARYPDARVLTYRFTAVDRALIDGVPAGGIRLVVRRGRILGATLLGPHAGELLHEIVLAMQAGVRLDRLSSAVHAYPTLAQIHRRAANTAYSGRLFSPGTRRLVRWLQRLVP
ncbi:Mercuric reductase [wastewater metagenome]|uniref:Mercuric reductase n=2 Tax=unclassified sequences TaxID=12908 RepID=A0A5B8RCX5_9ZZZZ|nr:MULTISPECIES: FAD-dependent oxidoreductase [Arhodomonas]MCS4503097.1 FAD-dependent oxidoreductase [Arhodomonas aquaeolei]QEA05963.1 mercuric reductase [uncultured organism]